MNKEELIQEFYKNFEKGEVEPGVYFSPGRVNLIGEHTDYNGGYVFPCALDFGTKLVIRKNDLNKYRFMTTNFDDRGEIPSKTGLKKKNNHWYNYPMGVIDQFNQGGISFTGIDFLFSGDIPNGAGLSSSASIETVTAFALNEIFELGFEKMEMVKLCQKAENEFVGVNCGIMDQFAVMMGEKDHALFLNCATLEYEKVPLKMDGYKLIISNTNKRRGLADSKYNERRSQCETAVEMLSLENPIENLSAISFDDFQNQKGLIKEEIVQQRAKHVISENNRVLLAIDALKANQLEEFGKLMNQSHDSLREDYEVTGVELDTLVEEARKVDGVLGSRMTGAGFGGCTVSRVEEEAIDKFKKKVGEGYYEKTGLVAEFYIAEVGDGAKEV